MLQSGALNSKINNKLVIYCTNNCIYNTFRGTSLVPQQSNNY